MPRSAGSAIDACTSGVRCSIAETIIGQPSTDSPATAVASPGSPRPATHLGACRHGDTSTMTQSAKCPVSASAVASRSSRSAVAATAASPAAARASSAAVQARNRSTGHASAGRFIVLQHWSAIVSSAADLPSAGTAGKAAHRYPRTLRPNEHQPTSSSCDSTMRLATSVTLICRAWEISRIRRSASSALQDRPTIRIPFA
jgi:hypothetical protein